MHLLYMAYIIRCVMNIRQSETARKTQAPAGFSFCSLTSPSQIETRAQNFGRGDAIDTTPRDMREDSTAATHESRLSSIHVVPLGRGDGHRVDMREPRSSRA